MKLWTKTLPILASLAMSTGCIGADDDPETSDTDADTGGTMTTMTPTTVGMTADDTADDTVGMTMGMTDDTGTGGTVDDTGTDTMTDSSTGPDPTVFIFDETLPEDYVQQDRKGFPAINTGLNLLGDKDAYNASNPAEDISMATAGENATESILHLHQGPADMVGMGTGLDDDLTGAGFDVCSITLGGIDCLDQAGPFGLPDTLNLTFSPDTASQFPNGRELAAPVMDVILAVLLLDLEAPFGGGDEPITRFLDLDDDGTIGDSLNPITNDEDFPGAWPYLAPPNE